MARNTITIINQNNEITVTDKVTGNAVSVNSTTRKKVEAKTSATNVTVENQLTNTVEVLRQQGPRGIRGEKGEPGQLNYFEDLTVTGSLFVSGTGHITASGNISASGNLTLGGGIIFDGDETISTVGASDDLDIQPDAKLRLGPRATDAIEIGRQTVGTGGAGRTEIYANSSTPAVKFLNSTITFTHPLTASIISASGQIFGTASFADDATSASYAQTASKLTVEEKELDAGGLVFALRANSGEVTEAGFKSATGRNVTIFTATNPITPTADVTEFRIGNS